MKKYYLLLLGIISSFSLLAQSKAISYQAVIMDPNQIEIPGQSIVGQPLSNGSVCLKFTILNADGSIDYEETQSTKTDEFGLVSLSIGGSTSSNNQSKLTILSTGKTTEFSAIKWDSKRKSLKVSVSFDNCSTFKVSSVELLNYTPYAMYAGAVDYNNVNGAPTNLSQFNNDAGFILPKDLDPLKKDILQTQNNVTNLSDKTASNFLVVNQQIAVLDSSNKNTTKKFAAIDTTLAGYNTRLTTNETTIKQTNTYVNQQVGGLQTQINTTNTNINQLGETYEVVSNKSDATNLGAGTPSNTLYPTQLAVKTYVDQTVQDAVASGAPDATTLAKGKIKLAGDLAGTADSPTVPGLANKENLSNKSTSISTDGGSNTKYPSAKAVKDYVDASVSGVAFQTNLDAKADKESPTFTGTPVLPTGTTGVTQSNSDNSTRLATTAFVQNAISAGVIDATTSVKGKIKLAGDLGGTADAPTVPGLANKENISNKSTATDLGGASASDTNYPSQNAVKTYVDNQVASATIADATNLVKGKIQLTGDLGGTAASPTVPGLANKENTITAGTSTQYFRGDKTWQTLDKSAVGLSNVDNTSDASKPISSATQTVLDLKAPLASPALTGTPTAPTATAGTNTTQIATTAFVTSALTSVNVSDATTTGKGIIQLAGDLGGTGTSATAPVITNDAITSAKIKDGEIVNADISSSAAIADSKLATISTSGKVSNSATTATPLNTASAIVSRDVNGDFVAGNITVGSVNGIVPTAAAVGYTIAGGTTSKTLTVSDDATVSGTNTGDQTITLTGDVTGTGTGSFATTIGSGKVTNGMLAGNIDLTTKVTGVLPVSNGGSGASTLTGYVKGNGTSAMTASTTIPLADVTGAAPSASPALTGTPTAPTATAGTNTTQIATTEFVTNAVSSGVASGITIGSIESSSTAKGATITSGVIKLAPADGTNPGIVTTGTQTFEGDKTFKANLVGKSIFKVGSGQDSPNALGGFTSGSNTYPSSPIIGIYGPMASATESTLLRLKLPLNYGSSIQSLADFVMSGGNKSKLTIKLGNQNDDDFVNALTLMNAASGSNPLVGINNTSPSSTLDVTGTSAVSGNATFGGTVGITGDITNSSLTASKAVFTDANKKLVSTGTLGLEQGGLGVNSITAGQVVFGNSSSAVGTSGNLSFDSSNKILKVGPGVTLGNAEDGFTSGSASYSTTPILGVYGPASTTSETTLLRLKRTHNQGTSYQAVADFVMEGGNKSKLTLKLGNESDNNFINALTMVGAPSSTLPLIGINNTSPAKTLDITGTLGVSGASTFAGDVTITSGSPGLGKVLTSDANGLASWSTPSSGGVTTIGSVAGSSTANGASISSSTLSLAPADGTNPGIVTTGTQTFAGTKTFSSTITGDISGNAGTVTNGVYTTNKISALAATTSTELASVISDETGTGSIVLSASPALSGTPTAPTAAAGTSTTQLATTAFVQAAIREVSDEISVTSDGQTSFTLTQTKRSASTLKMYINGIRISNSAYSVSGTTVTYVPANNGGKTTLTTDRVQFDYSY